MERIGWENPEGNDDADADGVVKGIDGVDLASDSFLVATDFRESIIHRRQARGSSCFLKL